MKFENVLGRKVLFFDGGMGTMLQAAGLQPGEIPEYWNFEKSDEIKKIHKAYLTAGANIIETNSFGANRVKFPQDDYSSFDAMYKSVEIARESIAEFKRENPNHPNFDELYVAASIGPCGALLEPLGEVSFDEAYDSFKELCIASEKAGADVILIETMTDTYEIKAAILAAKENTGLPIIASVMLDLDGKLLTGGNVPAIVALLEGLRVDAIGLNCGFGPDQMDEFLPSLMEETSLPIMVNSNAGLPDVDENGNTYWNSSPEIFGEISSEFVTLGVSMVGGCCGTTPAHIKALVDACQSKELAGISKKDKTLISSYSYAVEINDEFKIIGEKINPTGNKPLKEAMRNNNFDAVSSLALSQYDAGAHIIDINAGLPGIDEIETLLRFVKQVQTVCPAPVMIDTSNEDAMEKACRYYNGKPFINSVSGKRSSLDRVLPIAAKYGGVLIALTLDDNGIPKTADDRVKVALNIIEEAKKYGIDKKDIVVDPLTMTISSDKNAAITTLEAIRKLSEMGIKTSVGLSNVSFGLPSRDAINGTFFAQCLLNGLNTAIVNPSSPAIMDTYFSHKALFGQDEKCQNYIAHFSESEKKSSDDSGKSKEISLKDAIIKGLKSESSQGASKLLETEKPLDIVNSHIIPALDKVGVDYETGVSYLPQLLMSAEAAQSAFAVLQEVISSDPKQGSLKGKIVLATVKGDIHDIGKNIAKVLLENYGYDVIDLGKDVSPEEVLNAVEKENVHLVGLSALMTTTLPNMEATIALLRSKSAHCKIVVGGAVLTEKYALGIGADCYCKDAMATVKYAEQLDLL